MKDIDSEKKIAVLVDAENTQCAVLGPVLSELSKHGHIIVKRAYGDWSNPALKNWKNPLNELAVNPVQQFSYTRGKNSSDATMIIDAMDLLYSDRFDAFALVSSDSDFTRLASRLKESQIFVFGVGQNKTPVAFRNACDDFIYTEVLRPLEEEEDDEKEATEGDARKESKRLSKKELCCDSKLVNILRNAVKEYADEEGWAHLAKTGEWIKRQFPDFDSRNYGYATLTKLIEATALFTIDRRKSGERGHDIFVRDGRKTR